MTVQDNTTLIRKLYDAVNSKDLGTIASYGCAESEWLDVPFNLHLHGHVGHHRSVEGLVRHFPGGHLRGA